MNSETVEEIYQQFPLVLNQRVSHQRKLYQTNLSELTNTLVRCIVHSKDLPYLRELLDEQIGLILIDCEIYHGMTEMKAVDALIELSSLACLYVYTNNVVYGRICKLISLIQTSYPSSF